MLRTIRTVLWTLVAVVGVGAGWIWYTSPDGPGGSGTANGPVTRAIADAAEGQYGAGDYQLVNHDGETVDDSVFLGKPAMVFFGFTHCPDVCPTTLGDMQHWYAELGDDADRLASFFVTVDPERDTPEILGDYVGWASDRIVGLTGEPEDIEAVKTAWGVLGEKVEMENGDYTMNHTASVFLLDENGQFFGTIAYQENAETAIGKLRRLIES